MRYSVGKQNGQALTAAMWRRDVMSPFDVVAALSANLAPTWEIERNLDPDGELSVIVAPAGDDLTQSGFVLYEKDGFVEVATVFGDAWQGNQQFPSCQQAVAAIVSASEAICA